MKKISLFLASIFLASSFVSCSNDSLQAYLVKSQDKPGVITLDIPASILQLKNSEVSESTKNTLESLKKINLVALPYKNNEAAIQAERTTLDGILKKSTYKSLMRTKFKGVEVSVYYTGSEEAIDEIIIFGYADKKGVAVARVLGNDINPSAIIKMIQEVKINENAIDLNKFKSIFSK